MAEYCGVTTSAMATIGIVGAIVSSTPGFLIAAAGLATRDIFLLIKPAASDRAQVLFFQNRYSGARICWHSLCLNPTNYYANTFRITPG
ncbi:hypothetical protein ACFLUQ_02210 [Chloroflexota bacterium]